DTRTHAGHRGKEIVRHAAVQSQCRLGVVVRNHPLFVDVRCIEIIAPIPSAQMQQKGRRQGVVVVQTVHLRGLKGGDVGRQRIGQPVHTAEGEGKRSRGLGLLPEEGQPSLGADRLVELQGWNLGDARSGNVGDVVVHYAGAGRRWKQSLDLGGNRIELRLRNDLVGKRIPHDLTARKRLVAGRVVDFSGKDWTAQRIGTDGIGVRYRRGEIPSYIRRRG